MTLIDLKRLAAEVSVQHGIRIDADDPVMAVVTLNRLIFEQAVAQVLERVQAAVQEFDVAADKVQVRAGVVLAQEVRDCGQALRREIAGTVAEIRPTAVRRQAGNARWMAIGLALAVVLFGLGIWIGRTMR